MARNLLRSFLKLFKYDIIKLNRQVSLPVDFEEEHAKIIRKVAAYTMTSPERIFGLIEAVKYIGHFKIEGDIVECGVWRGGSMLAAAETLLRQNDTNRHLYLYDTFEGMPPPGREDISVTDQSAD